MEQAVHSRATLVEAGMLSNHLGNSATSLGTAPVTPPGFGVTSLGPQGDRPSVG